MSLNNKNINFNFITFIFPKIFFLFFFEGLFFCSHGFTFIVGEDSFQIGSLGLYQHKEILKSTLTVTHESWKTFFPQINNVELTNESTAGLPSSYGTINPNQQRSSYGKIRYETPFGKNGTFTWQINAPLPELIKIHTRSPYQPYYFYNDELESPTEFYLGYGKYLDAQKKHWLSLTLNSSFSLVAQTEFIAGINSNEPSSSIELNARIKSSLGWKVFYSYEFANESFINLFYQPSQHQQLTNAVSGRAPLGSTSALGLNFLMTSQFLFKPEIFQLNVQAPISTTTETNKSLYFSLAYENWSEYESSVIKITEVQGIIRPSETYSVIKGQYIWVPSLGVLFDFSKDPTKTIQKFVTALSYRPKSILSDINGSSNFIDSEKIIFALGLEGKLEGIYQYFTDKEDSNHPLNWQFGMQTHYLKKNQVNKSTRQEDGSTGEKIGAPGYQTGGVVLVGSFGVSYVF